MNTTTATPVEIDTELAALHHADDANLKRSRYAYDSLHSTAKSRIYHPVTWTSKAYYEYTLTDAEVLAAVTEAHAAAKADTYTGPMSEYDLLYGNVENALAAIPACEAEEARINEQIATLEAEYRRRPWSRFFLVTSSAGHVHSSMSCSTCRVTTTYGWLPELSGRTEAEAVAELGPALCSVCFASAPVAHQGGKITKAKAAKLAA
jgi:hypothetical protein